MDEAKENLTKESLAFEDASEESAFWSYYKDALVQQSDLNVWAFYKEFKKALPELRRVAEEEQAGSGDSVSPEDARIDTQVTEDELTKIFNLQQKKAMQAELLEQERIDRAKRFKEEQKRKREIELKAKSVEMERREWEDKERKRYQKHGVMDLLFGKKKEPEMVPFEETKTTYLDAELPLFAYEKWIIIATFIFTFFTVIFDLIGFVKGGAIFAYFIAIIVLFGLFLLKFIFFLPSGRKWKITRFFLSGRSKTSIENPPKYKLLWMDKKGESPKVAITDPWKNVDQDSGRPHILAVEGHPENVSLHELLNNPELRVMATESDAIMSAYGEEKYVEGLKDAQSGKVMGMPIGLLMIVIAAVTMISIIVTVWLNSDTSAQISSVQADLGWLKASLVDSNVVRV